MATEQNLDLQSFDANADLSAKQYRIVKVAADDAVDVVSDSTEDLIGILQGTPASGKSATVAVGGISKVLTGGSVSAGDLVVANSNAKAVSVVNVSDVSGGTLASMTKLLGKVVNGAGSDEYATVLIDKQIAG